MGYTNYWERTEKPITKDFVKAVKDILKQSDKLGITICGWDGSGTPVITEEEILFNGDAKYGLDYESFVLNNNETGFNFCKTARRPYDWTVKEVLAIAEAYGLVTDVSDDGKITHKNDKQWLYDEIASLEKRVYRT